MPGLKLSMLVKGAYGANICYMDKYTIHSTLSSAYFVLNSLWLNYTAASYVLVNIDSNADQIR